MSKELVAQIGYLHNKCPKGKEWSGLLIYKIEEGTIDNPGEFKIRAEQVFPMNLGEAGFTSFEAGNGWLNAFTQFPQIDPLSPTPGWRIGKIHSHHGMDVFHSSTDKGDLYATAPYMPMYLSLVVNYKSETDCELAIAIEVEETVMTRLKWKLKGWKENKRETQVKKNKEQKRCYIVHCDVEYEQEDWFKKQVDTIIEDAKPKYVYSSPYAGRVHDYSERTPGFQFGQNVNSGTNSSIKAEVPKTEYAIYQKMFSHVASLLTLGFGDTLTPYQALEKIDLAVDNIDKDDYREAMKNYYEHVWFPSYFTGMGVSKQQVVESIQRFTNLHKTLWISDILKKTLNELKKKYETERKAVVR